MVIVASGVLMVVMGVFGKVGAIFTTIPSPVIGGMFLVMFGVIAAAGISNLQVPKPKSILEKLLLPKAGINIFLLLTFSVCRYEFVSKHLHFWLLHVLWSGHS